MTMSAQYELYFLGALLVVLILFIIALIRTDKRRNQHTRVSKIQFEKEDGLAKLKACDEIASAYIRKLSHIGIARTLDAFHKTLSREERSIYLHWLARWGGLERDLSLLKRGLEPESWPKDLHDEYELWRIWQHYVETQTITEPLFKELLALCQKNPDRAGLPALTILFHWGIYLKKYRDIWEIWWTLPHDLRDKLDKDIHPLFDVLHYVLPHIIHLLPSTTLKKVAAYAFDRFPQEPIGYWILSHAEKTKPARAIRPLMTGIEKTENYWLMRELENRLIEQNQLQEAFTFYHELRTKHHDSLRTRVVLLLHELRVERIHEADTILQDLENQLSIWPPFWLWQAYVAMMMHDHERLHRATREYWHHIRTVGEHIHPFVCKKCGFGAQRWWSLCPTCERTGTMDLILPDERPLKPPFAHLFEMAESFV